MYVAVKCSRLQTIGRLTKTSANYLNCSTNRFDDNGSPYLVPLPSFGYCDVGVDSHSFQS